jgi:hypothetical protein
LEDECEIRIHQKVAVMAESLSLDFTGFTGTGGTAGTGGTSGTGGNTGANFQCTGACTSATALAKSPAASGNIGIEGRWYVVTPASGTTITGWQLSNGDGREVWVNGVKVSTNPAQVPLVPTTNGKYYFYFSAGTFEWAAWSWW